MRSLWWINLTLLILIVIVASLLRGRWQEARTRESRFLAMQVASAPAPAIPAIPGVTPSNAASYLEVAQQMLFARDRNPTIILDPPPAPPPPKPMPPLPFAHGVMNFGEGPTAILSEKSGGSHRGYRAGETIGAFKVVAMNNTDIMFEWEGKQIRKKFEELVDNSAVAAAQAAAAAAPPPAPSPAGATAVVAPVKPGPGVAMGNESKACQPGDPSPAGAVVDGMRKVLTKTPFGESCRWEPVK